MVNINARRRGDGVGPKVQTFSIFGKQANKLARYAPLAVALIFIIPRPYLRTIVFAN